MSTKKTTSPSEAMFGYLEDFDVVIVTGPQRSGTRIVAKAIAHDAGLTYTDETVFDVYDEKKFLDLVYPGGRLVIRCPAMSHMVHTIVDIGKRDDIAVVMVARDLDEIKRSENRIDWPDGARKKEEANYDALWVTAGHIAARKYMFWHEIQAHRIKHSFLVHHGDLEKHPLWVPRGERKGFDWDQTEVFLEE